jgi:hypothetical protein
MVWKPLGKDPHGRLKLRWEYNIKMDHNRINCADELDGIG